MITSNHSENRREILEKRRHIANSARGRERENIIACIEHLACARCFTYQISHNESTWQVLSPLALGGDRNAEGLRNTIRKWQCQLGFKLLLVSKTHAFLSRTLLRDGRALNQRQSGWRRRNSPQTFQSRNHPE